VKNSRAHVRVWAWFSSSGSGAIRRVEGKTADDYIDMLDEARVPEVWALNGLRMLLFLNNQSPVFPPTFYCDVFLNWLQEHPELSSEYWPRKSEDLNPFRNIWSEFQGALMLQRLQPTDADELWEGVEELWRFRSQKPSYWEGLINTLRANFVRVIESKGAA
jgi:hypothetical protein